MTSKKQDSDETLMAEKIGELAERNRVLERALNRAESEASVERYSRWIYNGILSISISVGILLVLALATIPIYKALTAEDTPTHCDVDFLQDQCGSRYRLRGVVPWLSDYNYGDYRSLEEALDAADLRGCVVKTVPNE
jgi:hypothetical protein